MSGTPSQCVVLSEPVWRGCASVSSCGADAASCGAVLVCAPGRVCLFGDKTDLACLPVVTATISRAISLSIKKSADPTQITMYSENFNSGLKYKLGEKGDFSHPLKYWCAVAYILRERISGFDAYATSTLPMGKGIASSGATSVALVKGLNKIFSLGLDKHQCAAIAYQAEHDELAIPCGRMDQWAISYGGVAMIQTTENPTVRELKHPSFSLVVGDTTEPRPLHKLLPLYKERLAKKEEILLDAFEKITGYLYEGAEAMERGDLKRVGELMSCQMEQENRIGAASERLNLLCRASVEAGAYGAKLMGVGGGGCMVALCNADTLDAVVKAIESVKGVPYPLTVANVDW
eukprot:TRINITY_DN22754_c0_g1_i1.p1 TRINITY_DN22754_c0_g1~~TRINITY_DN22754_c0_g1_i1.p1  ORF type:complete len:355 (+),score=48.22 TRINITY_DN22754_c0_g1_i1:24-1067(+)